MKTALLALGLIEAQPTLLLEDAIPEWLSSL